MLALSGVDCADRYHVERIRRPHMCVLLGGNTMKEIPLYVSLLFF